MRRIIILAVVLSLLSGAAGYAADAVDFAISIRQQDSAGSVLLLADTATVVEGVTASGFFLSMSLDIELKEADSVQAQFLAHVITLGPPAKTYGRSYAVEYGLPARLDGIVGKGGVTYALTLSPLARREVDTAQCPFDHHQQGGFRGQPSANLDLYTIPNSFADFYFQTYKGVMEYHYREFQEFFKFSLPGKFSVYMAPCALPSVLWDQRYGQAVNPTRSAAFTLLSNGLSSTDPFVINQTALLRSWGYAPPILSEGAANYLTLAIFDMKKLLKAGTVVPLDSLLDTYAYLEADPVLADRVAGTFVKYLIDTYGIGPFKNLYEQSHDLNLRTKLVTIFGKPIKELESEWRTYVDTFTIRFPQLAQEVERAEATMSYGRMQEYAQAMLDRSTQRVDSMFSLLNLKQAYFYEGNYYAAADAALAHAGLEEESPHNWMSVAAYQMMNGLYPQARENLRKGLALEPSNQMLTFNLALSHLFAGETATAESLLVEIVSNPQAQSPQGESRIILGEILRTKPSQADRARAKTYFTEAMAIFQQQVQASPSLATAYLWFGAAALGAGDTEGARTALETALFLETRPFYVGVINLWLGKAADVLGDHAVANDYYGRVLSGMAAAYTQAEAQRYVNKPYTQK